MDGRKKNGAKKGEDRGQGKKPMYNEPTVPVTMKVPKSKKEQFKKEAREKILKKWEKK